MDRHWNAIVVGSGFGGAATALELARAGKSVLVLERGRWVDRDDSAWDARTILIDQKYRSDTPYEAPQPFGRRDMYPNDVVGGNSVFYGGASLRLRETDFRRTDLPHPRNGDAHPADWPIRYDDLAPFYDEAEQLIGVAGVAGEDPTEPPRAAAFPTPTPAYTAPSQRLVDAARDLGLRPFHVPLAINYGQRKGGARCIQCTTCDLYPCKLGAKNDIAVTLLPLAIAAGAEIRDRSVATRLVREGDRVTGVECVDVTSGQRFTFTADVVVASAGAIASARLLLASGLNALPRNGPLIGRYLMRHCTSVAIGIFPDETNPEDAYTKQLGLTDFYHGHPDRTHGPDGPWGMIQGLQVPVNEYIDLGAPFPFNKIGVKLSRRMMVMIQIAEDLPLSGNRVTLHGRKRDPFGEPIASVHHRYTRRDYAARRALYRESARVLKRAGARVRLHKPIYTFSHQVGTCRFGDSPERAVLDPACRVFGTRNLFVVDGGFMPTSGGVNPSLTIAANALRVGRHLAAEWTAVAGAEPAP